MSIGKTKIKKVGGGELQVEFNTANSKTQYYDECTDEAPPNELVRAAMTEEMSYFSENTAWTAAEYADMTATKKPPFVRMR